MLGVCIFSTVTSSFPSSLPLPSARRQAEGGGRLHPAAGRHGDAGHFRERAASRLAGVGSHLPPRRGGGLQRYVLPAQLTWAARGLRWQALDKVLLSKKRGSVRLSSPACPGLLGGRLWNKAQWEGNGAGAAEQPFQSPAIQENFLQGGRRPTAALSSAEATACTCLLSP